MRSPDAELVVVATPIPTIPALVAAVLSAAPQAIVTDVGSVKTHLVRTAEALAAPGDLPRFVPGHPMGGSERSGPEHASASVVDGIVWAITPHTTSDPGGRGSARIVDSRAGGEAGAVGACPP